MRQFYPALAACKFIAQDPDKGRARALADDQRKRGVRVKMVRRREGNGHVWKLFDAGSRSQPQARTERCPHCKGSGRVSADAPSIQTPAVVAWLDSRPPEVLTKPKTKAKRVPIPIADPASDPRLPSNTKPHEEAPYSGPGLKAAAASRERRRRMLACMCRLCALCLNPPQTLAEAARVGVDTSDTFPPTYDCHNERGTYMHGGPRDVTKNPGTHPRPSLSNPAQEAET